jgi:N-acylneuraminate cytidylyltransferase/CMP-N,N'-diacetyllegionaminic acid synthase
VRVVAVIPARAGSKRVPGKNLRLLGGRPLVAHSIEDARAARVVDRVIVSTDSEEVVKVALDHGAEAPFLRPAVLAGDRVSDTPVVAHAAQWLEDHEGYAPDVLVLLRPTTPVRAPGLIERCVERLVRTGADSVRSVRNVGHWHPYWMLSVDADGFAQPFLEGKTVDDYYQSQLLPPVFKHDGYCDVIRRANVPRDCPATATLAGFYGRRRAVEVNPDPDFVNIDTDDEFVHAEWVLARRGRA